MSGSVVTIGGGSSPSGIVSVPSSLPATVNQLLQQYLSGFTTTGGSGDLISTTGGSSVGAGVQSLIVNATGDLTVTGSGSTTVADFGSSSNVDYLVQNASSGAIFASGGSDTISLLPSINNVNDSIYSSGHDSINLFAGGNDAVSVMSGANDTVNVTDANATVTAEGNATVGIWWASRNSGGTLDFVNNSSTAATVFSSVFNQKSGPNLVAPNSVTVFGGDGGGYYNGGQAGNNSLVGGAGVVTLVGANSGDFLEANSSIGQNALFAGSGSETLEATSLSGSNQFAVGLPYPGLPNPVGNDLISTAGSGQQNFHLGNGTATIYGSTAATANVFNIYGDSTTGGGDFIIHNFVNATMFLTNATDNGPGDATIKSIGADPIYGNSTEIILSDNTQIHLIGVSSSSVTQGVGVNSAGTTFIHIQ